jgi:hypothetical protein
VASNPSGLPSIADIAKKNALPGSLMPEPTETPAEKAAPGKYTDHADAAQVQASPSPQRKSPFGNMK